VCEFVRVCVSASVSECDWVQLVTVCTVPFESDGVTTTCSLRGVVGECVCVCECVSARVCESVCECECE